MSAVVLEIHFNHGMTQQAYRAAAQGASQPVANVKGLCWKIWLESEATNEGGGVYLFEDQSAAQAYLEGPIVSHLRRNPLIKNFRAEMSSVLESPTKGTRDPIPV